MRIGLIGLGQAGGKIADRILEYDVENGGDDFVKGCVAVNTARKDLSGLSVVPEENRVLIGESKVKGNGVGADNKRGKDIMQAEYSDILDKINQMPLHNIDCFILTAALGGGTGSGSLPVMSRIMRERYSEPVYALGVLPSTNEPTIYSVNAARSLKSTVEESDNLLLFDNDLWSTSKSLEDSYDELNTKIANRFGELFSAGEMQAEDNDAQRVVDASEVINTLNSGGITALGYAKSNIDDSKVNPGLLKRLMNKDEVDQNKSTTRIKSLVESAISGKLTLEANVKTTERALILVSGPSKFLTRKGIEIGTELVEEEADCLEVRGGDYPTHKSEVSVTVVLSGIYDAQRIKDMQKLAVEAENEIEEIRDNRDSNLDELLEEDRGKEVDSLLDV